MELEKVMISQEDLEALRFDASRSPRGTTAVVVSTAIAVGAAAVAGYAVYHDIKDRREHMVRMNNITQESIDIKNELADLKRKMGDA